ncbi:MAG TPA: Gfo/Idh/MocA family oxidoreductase, partial [Baekduia sp.]|nr:Gfo/Idh/MocA family oxidoreductase [Baekduia sp.]
LQEHPDLEFAGAVDPSGDRYGAVDAQDMLTTVAELLERAPDFAIVAVPTNEHLPAVRELAAAGVHVLIEKPVAADAAEADELIALVRAAGVHGAVGHVERFNPALVKLRSEMNAGRLGEVFSISTERVGPYPDRIRDVGVVKDLGVHDLDLVRWLGGAPVARLAAETQHRMGQPHEDAVLITGQLTGGQAFNCVVNWISPTKIRQTRVLGEHGMFVADTLTPALTFFAFDGVKEGGRTDYELGSVEPLRAEIDAFVALLRDDEDPGIVSLEDGLDNVVLAEAALRSAADGVSVTLQEVAS